MMHCIGDNLKKKLPVVGFSSKPRIVRCFAEIISIFVLESQNCGIFIKPIKLIEPLLYQPSFGDLFGKVGSWVVINTQRKHMQNESNMEVPSLTDSKFCMK